MVTNVPGTLATRVANAPCTLAIVPRFVANVPVVIGCVRKPDATRIDSTLAFISLIERLVSELYQTKVGVAGGVSRKHEQQVVKCRFMT
jgi:hypothetical protein